MKSLTLLTFITLLLSACSLGVSQEFQSPTPALVIPTAVIQPSDIASPTATNLTEATAVAITPTPFLTPPPQPTATAVTPSLAQFRNLRFASTGNGWPQVVFDNGTEEVFAIWDYTDLTEQDVVTRLWRKNGEGWLVREEVWDVATYGNNGTVSDISVYDFEGNGLEPGLYELVLYVNGTMQASANFQIQAEANLATSTEAQVAWVQEGHILMLDAWDGSQRELARIDEANEIVELLWLPDARHLLYVDQQAADPTGPPWPKHALWIVDTETAVSQQLSTFDENLHRIALLPNAHYIRTLPGSDFGDACFMDRGLVFVELDENYGRVDLHDFRNFDGVPTDEGYWFFPEDAGKWVSDHEYEVNLTAYCLSPEMSSEEDLGLLGRYRLDVGLGTAVKVGD